LGATLTANRKTEVFENERWKIFTKQREEMTAIRTYARRIYRVVVFTTCYYVDGPGM
jgi:hypothetical protein